MSFTAIRLVLGVLLGAVLGAASDHRLAHFYYLDDAAAAKSLAANYRSIGLVSPAWFTVAPNGEFRSNVDDQMVAWAAEHHMPLMPIVSNLNFDSKVIDEALSDRYRDRVVLAIVNNARAYGAAGVQLDFENVEAAQRDAFTKFVEQLGAACKKQHMTLSLAVPAPLTPGTAASANQSRWVPNERAAAFDYAALSRAADFLTLMAYDEYTAPDAPGPIAGLPWVEACIQKIVASVPGQKVTLGLPLYYRRWTGRVVTEGPYPEARAASEQAAGKMTFDPFHQEWTFRAGQGNSAVVVWGHNGESIRKRMELVERYGLRGYSAWRLGQEDPEAWGLAFRSDSRRGS